MKKITFFLMLLCCTFYSFAGIYNISTATNGSGVYVTPGNVDPKWKVSAPCSTAATFNTYSVPAFAF